MFKRKITKRVAKSIKVGDKLIFKFIHKSIMVGVVSNVYLQNDNLNVNVKALDFGTELTLDLDAYVNGVDTATLSAMGITGIYKKCLDF